MEQVTVITIVIGRLQTVPKGLENLGEIVVQKKNQEHTDYSIVKIGKDT